MGKQMSRHVFTGLRGHTRIAIGWDRPLETFFVHVTRQHPRNRGEEQTLFWKGTAMRELTTAAAAIATAQPWALLPTDLGITLETDRLRTLGISDGEHQAAMMRRLSRD